MRYIDTSVLVAYLTREAHSVEAEAFMLSQGTPLVMSTWTEVEFLSALGKKLRTKQLTKSLADSIVHQYRQSISSHVRLIPVTDADLKRAAMLLDGWKTSVRAADSLHLAISSGHGATTYTLDRGMALAGATLGVAVTLL
ncbi:PIN domain-containing protein [Pseudoduganella sp. FT55W]|uniref:Ribonuclease VapC n=1 Tax=Duganella rivi TaxID=2666083 RepID=A0A7X4KE13_9BURK|nr:type II toxin-antitoxin system VapC family toxin [Duganella rivi]MYM69622.1 PIN domain-containing protein [Duganella rivi]